MDGEACTLIAWRCSDHYHLGNWGQIDTPRFFRTFLTDPVNIPVEVIAYVAFLLRKVDPDFIIRYAEVSRPAFSPGETHLALMDPPAFDRYAWLHCLRR